MLFLSGPMAARTSTKGPYMNIVLEDGFSKTTATPRANATEYNNAAMHAIWFPSRTEAHPTLPSYLAALWRLVREMHKNTHEAHTGAIQSRPPLRRRMASDNARKNPASSNMFSVSSGSSVSVAPGTRLMSNSSAAAPTLRAARATAPTPL